MLRSTLSCKPFLVLLGVGFAYAISAVYPAQYLIRRYGKRAALSLILAFGIVNFALSWFMYTPEAPWLVVLHTGLSGFCATGLWVVLPSMTADSLDYEEQRTGARREGAFSSSFFWATKAGMGIASIMAGQALTRRTGFRAELGGQQAPDTYVMIRALFAGIPIVACLVALALLRLYPLSAQRMSNIRAELEARRGVV
jgi:GPH family glycoside/pentoside/hexuronide:cation symporter